MFPFLPGSLGATLSLALYLVPPGFCFAQLTDLASFRSRAWVERLAWSVALSYPIATMIAVLLGHYAPAKAANVVFIVLAVAMVLLSLAWRRTGTARTAAGTGWIAVCFAGVVALALVATCAVRVHGHLLEGVCSNDWYIRLPVQWAAGHDLGARAVPPLNPLFTLDGHNPPMRYYYFFYVLCGEPMRLFGLSARSVMVGGVAWAGVVLFSVAMLLVKYLVVPVTVAFEEEESNLVGRSSRPGFVKLALVFFAVSCVTGLDILPNLPAIVGHQPPYPSVYWWSNYGISSWPGFLPFIPHHFMGMSCGLLGYLLLLLPGNRRHRIAAAAMAGVCFAALLGTSTFLALCTCAAVGMLGMLALWRKRWQTVAGVAGSLLLMACLDTFYIRETFLAPAAKPAARDAAQSAAGSAAQGGGGHFQLGFLHWYHAHWMVFEHVHALARVAARHPGLGLALSVVVLIVLYCLHWGFFGFVLWFKVRQDWRRPLAFEAQAMWVFFLTATAVALFVSSEPLQGVRLNDLGRLSSLIARVLLMLWACPLVIAAWERMRLASERQGPAMSRGLRLAVIAAAVCAALGLWGAGYDVWMERTYLVKVDRGSIPTKAPFEFPAGVGAVYAEMSDAWDAIGRTTPADAVLQANPNGLMQRPVLLYLNRRVAAGDVSCETSFGGSRTECEDRVTRPLLALYGGPVNDERLASPANMSMANFARVCASVGLYGLLADEYDPAWKQADGWVWREPAVYAGEHVRVLRCPAN